MKSQVRLVKMIEGRERMARGRLGVLSRGANGGKFYHLQYRRNTKLFQKYIPADQAAAYEKATATFRTFMKAVEAYVDEMSARTMSEIAKEAKDAKRKAKANAR